MRPGRTTVLDCLSDQRQIAVLGLIDGRDQAAGRRQAGKHGARHRERTARQPPGAMQENALPSPTVEGEDITPIKRTDTHLLQAAIAAQERLPAAAAIILRHLPAARSTDGSAGRRSVQGGRKLPTSVLVERPRSFRPPGGLTPAHLHQRCQSVERE